MPAFLRAGVIITHACAPRGSGLRKICRFLLDHPRRVTYMIFPKCAARSRCSIADCADETVMLLATVFVLTSVDWVCYFILETGNAVAFGPPAQIAVLDGFAQSVAVRSAGFYVNAPSMLEPANQVLYGASALARAALRSQFS